RLAGGGAVGSRKLTKIVVERVVLFHDHNDVLNCGKARKHCELKSIGRAATRCGIHDSNGKTARCGQVAGRNGHTKLRAADVASCAVHVVEEHYRITDKVPSRHAEVESRYAGDRTSRENRGNLRHRVPIPGRIREYGKLQR